MSCAKCLNRMSHLFLPDPSERRSPAGAKPAFDEEKCLSLVSESVKQFCGSYSDTCCFWNFRPPGVMAGLVPAIHGLQPMTS